MHFSQKILKWFDQHGRHDLPWQHNPTPYRVWISEIMLQQTQVATVWPYFERFIKRFPNIQILANARLDSVLQLWAGLGYYARAKNLHKTAQIIHEKYQGIFPLDYQQVLALPGIGRSTAGAILAISALQQHPILDGNVKRILSRHFAIEGTQDNPKTTEQLWDLSNKMTPQKRVNHYTQAIMDLGATLCTRTKPKCSICPIARTCKAFIQNQVLKYPGRRTKSKQTRTLKTTTLLMLVQLKPQLILLEKRPVKGIWGGLWSLPECPINVDIQKWCYQTYQFSIDEPQTWGSFKHGFTHFDLDIHPVLCKLRKKPPNISSIKCQWHSWEKSQHLGLPAPVKRLIEKMNA
jgi:A/G-specific adenine glycosylase